MIPAENDLELFWALKPFIDMSGMLLIHLGWI